jgi:NADPH-dependent 7-cyano-7-deazaguanine reductase QueF-like protein
VVLEIEHVIFEYDGEDEWGYPIIKLNEKGEPIVADVKLYPVTYRKTEVKNMFAWLRENRNNLRKKS